MFSQIALGTLVILITIVVSGIAYLILEGILTRSRVWMQRDPHPPKLLLMLIIIVVWVLGMVTVAVWLWAFVFWGLGVFITVEGAVYFSITAFTTLGFGDILLPIQWRLLGGMAAVNGLLNLGLSTAMMVEALRFVRVSQLAASKN